MRIGTQRSDRKIYEVVHAILKHKIQSHDLAQDLCLKEGQLASIFGVSRAPVRRAIGLLKADGLVSNTEGRGFLVGPGRGGSGKRISLQELQKVLVGTDAPDLDRSSAWKPILQTSKREIISCLPFGTYRVLETEMARHFDVSRTVVREVLARLSELGIIEKNNRSQWIAGPLTAKDLREIMDVRLLLEPHALMLVACNTPALAFHAMHLRLTSQLGALSQLDSESCFEIERSLHRSLLRDCGNARIVDILERNQLHVAVEDLFCRRFGVEKSLPLIGEHEFILGRLAAGDVEVAQAALRSHLMKTADDLLRKLRVLSVLPKPCGADYLTEA